MNFADMLVAWYRENARSLPWRETNDPYAVWVSEIMLQQTRISAVLPYYARFMEALPDVYALAAADDERLHKLWEGLGYYARARNLKRAAQIIANERNGVFPASYDEWLLLPGIGAYTAGALASIVCGERVPAVDGNVLRVYARLFDDERDIADMKTRADVRAELLPAMPAGAPGAFNAALMELGERVCLPGGAPRCGDCPLHTVCLARARGTAARLPVKSPKKARRVEDKTVFALLTESGYLVLRRPETGLLAGLWQLPDVAGLLDERRAAEQIAAWGSRVRGELMVYHRTHAFTHIEWHMRVYAAAADCDTLPAGFAALDAKKALPTAYRVCLPETLNRG